MPITSNYWTHRKPFNHPAVGTLSLQDSPTPWQNQDSSMFVHQTLRNLTYICYGKWSHNLGLTVSMQLYTRESLCIPQHTSAPAQQYKSNLCHGPASFNDMWGGSRAATESPIYETTIHHFYKQQCTLMVSTPLCPVCQILTIDTSNHMQIFRLLYIP